MLSENFFKTWEDSVKRLMNAIKGHDHPHLAELHSPSFKGTPLTTDMTKNTDGSRTNGKQIVNYDSLDKILAENAKLGKRQTIVYGPMDKNGKSDFFRFESASDDSSTGLTYKHVLHFDNDPTPSTGTTGLFKDDVAPAVPWVTPDRTALSVGANITETATSASNWNSNGKIGKTGAGWVVNSLVGRIVTIVSGTGAGQTRVVKSNTASEIITETKWSTGQIPSGSVFRVGDFAEASGLGNAVMLTAYSNLIENTTSPAQYTGGDGSWDESFEFVVNEKATTNGNTRWIYSAARKNGDRGVIVEMKRTSGDDVIIFRADTRGSSGNEVVMEHNLGANAYVNGTPIHIRIIYDSINFVYFMFVDGAFVAHSYSATVLTSNTASLAANKLRAGGDKTSLKNRPVKVITGSNTGETNKITDVYYDILNNRTTLTFEDDFSNTFANGDQVHVRYGNIFEDISNDNKLITRRRFGEPSTTDNRHKGKISINEYVFKWIADSHVASYIATDDSDHLDITPGTTHLVPTSPVNLEVIPVVYNNNLYIDNPVGYGYGIIFTGAFLFSDYMFDLFNENGTYSPTAETKVFDNLTFENKHYLYAELDPQTKAVTMGWTPVSPQYGAAYIPGNVSSLIFRGPSDHIDIFGNSWRYNDTAVSIDEGIAVSSSDAGFIKSNIKALPERWTMRLRLKIVSLPTTPLVLLSFTDDDGTVDFPTNGLRLSVIRVDAVNATVRLEAGGTTVDRSINISTNHVYEIDVSMGTKTVSLAVAQNNQLFNLAGNTGDVLQSVDVSPETTLTIGATSDGVNAGNLDTVEIYGFEMAPYVATKLGYVTGNVGEPGNTVNNTCVMVTNGQPIDASFYNTNAGVMFRSINAVESLELPIEPSNPVVRVFFGDVTLDDKKIVEVNSYAVNGRYVMPWSYINNTMGNFPFNHCIGTNDIRLTTYVNRSPSDRLKWKEEGACYAGSSLHGLAVVDITSSKAKFRIGDGGISNLLNVNNVALTEGYVKTIVERDW